MIVAATVLSHMVKIKAKINGGICAYHTIHYIFTFPQCHHPAQGTIPSKGHAILLVLIKQHGMRHMKYVSFWVETWHGLEVKRRIPMLKVFCINCIL